MQRLAYVCGRISLWFGRFSATLLFVVGLILSYEVCARYFFNAPTIWIHDFAVTAQVWFVYLGMAYVLQGREMIRITAVIGALGPAGRRVAEAFALVVIIAMSGLTAVLMWEMIAESIARGRRQPTMLSLPNWVVELPVLIGFVLLGLQAVVNLIRLPFEPAPEFRVEETH